MSEPMVVRSVTVAEVMDGDGEVSLQIFSEGDPHPWDMLVMLMSAVQSVNIDIAAMWAVSQDDEEDA